MSIRVCVRYIGVETYAVRFDDRDLKPVNRAIGSWAGNPDLSFDWADAAVMHRTIRNFAPCPVCEGELPAPTSYTVTLSPGPPPDGCLAPPIIFPKSQEEKPCGDDH